LLELAIKVETHLTLSCLFTIGDILPSVPVQYEHYFAFFW
jgi:hypothetical protein